MFTQKILAIETSCDETAMAFVRAKRKAKGEKEDGEPEFEILAQAVSSQIDIHRPYGGVVPSLAKREHLKNLPLVLQQIINCMTAGVVNVTSAVTGHIATTNGLSDVAIDCIAVTVGPGLEPALWTGINFAKELSVDLQVPLVGVNHLEGHLYSNWLPKKIHDSPFMIHESTHTITFPAIVLVVSGGHTIVLHMENMKKWTKLGETQDDAAGEAFDKVAKMLGLPYPGGPEVEKAAHSIIGSPTSIIFPRPMLHSGDYNFSFSGLKTAVFYYIRSHTPPLSSQDNTSISHICAGFQEAVIDVLVKKTMRAAEEYGAQSVLLCGGVAANKALQERLRLQAQSGNLMFYVPELQYNTDNAVMIAAAAYLGNQYPTDKALPNLNL